MVFIDLVWMVVVDGRGRREEEIVPLGDDRKKKTDNRDCAIKNPDKWGAEKSENDNNRIERSVKDDDPAQAGFFLVSGFECRRARLP